MKIPDIKLRIGFIVIVTAIALSGFAYQAGTQNNYSIKLARLKYNGGGDWYSSRTALTNLAKFCNSQLKTSIDPNEAVVEASSSDIFNYPYIFMTGHGNVVFNSDEIQTLRTYLEAGGFLHICDNFGMDKFVRSEMKKVFPELSFVELPASHPIYKTAYSMPNGLPKVHEHEGKAPQGLGLIWNGRLVCFYDYESDLGNGWEDAEVYNDPESIRQLALKMGANIIKFAFQQQ